MKSRWGTTCVIILVSYMEFRTYSNRKKQKWQFSMTPLLFDAPYPAHLYTNIGGLNVENRQFSLRTPIPAKISVCSL